MRSLGASGIWELFIPGVAEGSRYKFELRGQDGDLLLRADPFAFETELPPKTASVVNRTRYEWTDDGWMALRQQSDRLRAPMSVYEVHLGSWRLNPLEDKLLADSSSWPTSWPPT
jgi:1,4-alpha-glucan branching enzyme